MNREVAIEGRTPREAASEWLRSHGFAVRTAAGVE